MIHATGRGDSLYILDWLPRTVNVYSPRYEFVRAQYAGAVSRDAMFPLPRGQLLIGTQMGAPSQVGYPLHLLGSGGEIIRSFGSLTRERRPDLPIASVRRVALSPANDVWTSYIHQYVIERWSLEGELLQVVERKAAWFEPWDGAQLRDVGMYHPPPNVRGITADSSGTLFVSVQVAKPDWRRRADTSRVVTPLTERRQYAETIIEAIDPASGGRLLGSQRIADVLYPIGGNYFWSARGDDAGRMFIDVWQAVVRR
jgi:hypothetical protein